jgi:Arm DNA-binding domain
MDRRHNPRPPQRKLRLTRAAIAALPRPPAGKLTIAWDDAGVTGLGVRMLPSGRATWFLQMRTKAGRPRKLTVGRAGRITPEMARENPMLGPYPKLAAKYDFLFCRAGDRQQAHVGRTDQGRLPAQRRLRDLG